MNGRRATAAAELVVPNLIAPKLPRGCDARPAELLSRQFAPVEALEFGIPPHGMQRRFCPQEPQEWVPLFTQAPRGAAGPLEYSLGIIPT